jgi:hypothetical protein
LNVSNGWRFTHGGQDFLHRRLEEEQPFLGNFLTVDQHSQLARPSVGQLDLDAGLLLQRSR